MMGAGAEARSAAAVWALAQVATARAAAAKSTVMGCDSDQGVGWWIRCGKVPSVLVL